MKRAYRMMLAGVFGLLAVAGGAMADGASDDAPRPPLVLTNVVIQTYGDAELAAEEIPQRGLLFLDEDDKVRVGDGETRGGRMVCVGFPPDLYSWTNDVSANGNALLWNGKWSQVAEGGSLLLRFGTNSWLRLVGEDAGENASMYVTDYDPTNGTMRLVASTTSPDAQVLVATNLMDAVAWSPATNAEVVAATDASTTWLVSLLGSGFQSYRVRTATTLPAGIHAERTLHANQGISIPEGQQLAFGTNSIGGWSDLFPYLSPWFIPAEISVDPYQFGATTNYSISGRGIAFTRATIVPYPYMLTNFYGITLSVGSPGRTLAISSKERAALVVPGGMFSLVRDDDECFASSSVEIRAPAVALDNSTNRLEAVGGDLAWGGQPVASEDAVAQVEERVGALESELHDWPDTCLIYWDDEYVTNSWNEATRTIPIPTNFPTRRLELIVSDVGITNLTVNLPKWAPDRSVEIFVQVLRTSTAPTNRATYVRINNNSTSALAYTAYNQYRVVILRYDVVSESWGTYAYSQPARSYWWSKSGVRTTFPLDCPATVEEWIAAYGARKNGTPTLSMSPSLSPSAGHLELLDSLDAIDVPAADEPDEFEPAAEAVE